MLNKYRNLGMLYVNFKELALISSINKGICGNIGLELFSKEHDADFDPVILLELQNDKLILLKKRCRWVDTSI